MRKAPKYDFHLMRKGGIFFHFFTLRRRSVFGRALAAVFRWAPEKEILGHYHEYDHWTMLFAGTVDVEANGLVTRYVAPAMIFTARNVRHRIVPVTRKVIYACVFPWRDEMGRVTDDLNKVSPKSNAGLHNNPADRLFDKVTAYDSENADTEVKLIPDPKKIFCGSCQGCDT